MSSTFKNASNLSELTGKKQILKEKAATGKHMKVAQYYTCATVFELMAGDFKVDQLGG